MYNIRQHWNNNNNNVTGLRKLVSINFLMSITKHIKRIVFWSTCYVYILHKLYKKEKFLFIELFESD